MFGFSYTTAAAVAMTLWHLSCSGWLWAHTWPVPWQSSEIYKNKYVNDLHRYLRRLSGLNDTLLWARQKILCLYFSSYPFECWSDKYGFGNTRGGDEVECCSADSFLCLLWCLAKDWTADDSLLSWVVKERLSSAVCRNATFDNGVIDYRSYHCHIWFNTNHFVHF